MEHPIRVLPMSAKDDEFHDDQGEYSPEKVQQEFFVDSLSKKGAKYYYWHSGLNAPRDSIVLFQYQNQIIAKANLDRTERSGTGDSNGVFCFSSVQVFAPISFDRMKRIWPKVLANLTHFTNAKLKLSAAGYQRFEPLSRVKPSASHREDSPDGQQAEFAENKQIMRERSFFARNPELARRAKARDSYTCQICSFKFRDAYGKLGESYAECHHLNPLSEHVMLSSDDSIITRIDRVVTLCANCHRMVHRERPALTIERVKKDFARAAKKRGGPYAPFPRD